MENPLSCPRHTEQCKRTAVWQVQRYGRWGREVARQGVGNGRRGSGVCVCVQARCGAGQRGVCMCKWHVRAWQVMSSRRRDERAGARRLRHAALTVIVEPVLRMRVAVAFTTRRMASIAARRNAVGTCWYYSTRCKERHITAWWCSTQ